MAFNQEPALFRIAPPIHRHSLLGIVHDRADADIVKHHLSSEGKGSTREFSLCPDLLR